MDRAPIETPDTTRSALRAAAIAFVLLIAAGPLCFALLPRIQTRATPPWPEWSSEAFLDGRYTESLRRHLRESSPLTMVLRGVHAEAEYLIAEQVSGQVIVGSGGFLFLRANAAGARAGIERQRADRVAAFADVARWSRDRGCAVIVVVVPDKSRVYADRWAPGGELPPGRRDEYRELLRELADAGLPAVDLETAFAEWRRARPAELLYLERDTHWNAHGAWVAAHLVAERIRESGLEPELGPTEPLLASPLETVVDLPDLAGLLGFLPGGLFHDDLLQPRPIGVVLRRDADGLPFVLDAVQPSARVALAGDSFAQAGLGAGLTGALGRAVDTEGAIAAGGPLRGLVQTMERIDRGELDARVLVWEFVERAQASEDWGGGPDVPGVR